MAPPQQDDRTELSEHCLSFPTSSAIPPYPHVMPLPAPQAKDSLSDRVLICWTRRGVNNQTSSLTFVRCSDFLLHSHRVLQCIYYVCAEQGLLSRLPTHADLLTNSIR